MSLLQKYHHSEAAVAKKDGLMLVREMAAEVKNMMDFKKNAIMVSFANIFIFINDIYMLYYLL